MIHYADVDPAPYNGLSYYRLKQTDYDGSFDYSDLVAVYVPEGAGKEGFFSVHPNPASELIEITFGSDHGTAHASPEAGSSGTIYLFDARAELIYEKEFEGDFVKFGVNLNYFSPGIYFVTLVYNDTLYKAKFVKK